jgi:Fic family protein
MGKWPSELVLHFEGRPLPEAGRPAGYAALVQRHALEVPLAQRLTAIARRHHPTSTNEWLMLTPRHRPEDTTIGHLAFALRWEGVDLSVLCALFKHVAVDELEAYVRNTPNGTAARRLWFLYEWLTGSQLDVPDAGKVRLVPVVDADLQVALTIGVPSRRHKVMNNLPGTPAFCPMVRRTPALVLAGASRLDARAREVIGRTRTDIISRAAAFLTLKDSKSSFAIEHEQATGSRAARWGQAIGQAGTRPLSIVELERLQRIVVSDRFTQMGLRREGGFVGEHDRDTSDPIPDHISARPQDLVALLEGLVAYGERAISRGIDPVAAAAAMAFGFVYIHPFEDGNGRLHRWMIHHVLAISGFSPPGLVFPISAAILRRIDTYREVLESISRPLLSLIEWRPTPTHNVEVLNDTARYYRYFDATRHVEFLYECVAQTVEHDLPEEVAFLEAYDRFNAGTQEIVDMPSRSVELLRKFLDQNSGRLSARARRNEFAMLSNEEGDAIERLYTETFSHRVEQPRQPQAPDTSSR